MSSANKHALTSEIIEALARATAPSSQGDVWVRPYEAPAESDERHQFVLFLKLEVVTPHRKTADVPAIIDSALDTISGFGPTTVHAVRVLSGAYVSKLGLIEEHYGVINAVYNRGVDALTLQALDTLNRLFEKELDNGTRVVGGCEFKDMYPGQFSSLVMHTLNQSVGTQRLGLGAYTTKVKVLDASLIVLNIFYEYQLEPYS